MKKQEPEKLKTRPDLDDENWLGWTAAQPENRGIDVRVMYRKMLEWCHRKGQTPTRRRLLRWLDNERDAVPLTYEPPYLDKAAEPEKPGQILPDCEYCGNERFISAVVDPDAKFEFARTGMIRCPKCKTKE